MRFYEIHAKSAINRVPAASKMPFRWTINPYRGCTHACVFCFARPTHNYLGFDAGRDFEREIVVKVNVPEVVRAELRRPSWKGEHVAMGTNTDPYQWVESRYKLMPGIWEAMRDARNPCSILTKSPLLLRDLDLLKQIAQVTDIHANLSIPTLDVKACIQTALRCVLDVRDAGRPYVADALSRRASRGRAASRTASFRSLRPPSPRSCRTRCSEEECVELRGPSPTREPARGPRRADRESSGRKPRLTRWVVGPRGRRGAETTRGPPATSRTSLL